MCQVDLLSRKSGHDRTNIQVNDATFERTASAGVLCYCTTFCAWRGFAESREPEVPRKEPHSFVCLHHSTTRSRAVFVLTRDHSDGRQPSRAIERLWRLMLLRSGAPAGGHRVQDIFVDDQGHFPDQRDLSLQPRQGLLSVSVTTTLGTCRAPTGLLTILANASLVFPN